MICKFCQKKINITKPGGGFGTRFVRDAADKVIEIYDYHLDCEEEEQNDQKPSSKIKKESS